MSALAIMRLLLSMMSRFRFWYCREIKMTVDIVYIGKVEAWEIAIERGIFELPRKGKEIVTCYAIAEKISEGKQDDVLGKDEHGFYIGKYAEDCL
jgi:hypothetical protein